MDDKCEVVNINGANYIREDLVPPEKEGRFVIVRCSGAGVHAGTETERTNETVTLANAIRLWRWHGRTLNGLALEGTDDTSKCKFGPMVPEITLNGWHEIIQCTVKAKANLLSVGEWRNEK